jgi:hypothetical protein
MAVAMAAECEEQDYRRAFTRDDIADVTENGLRHEIIDGTLIVSPAPGRFHQRARGADVPAARRRLPG